MRLTIVNLSATITRQQLDKVIAALDIQVKKHFAPEWKVQAQLHGVMAKEKSPKVNVNGRHDAIIYLGDDSQDSTTGTENAFGYHSTTFRNIPYGFVYLDVCSKYKENWTTTLSHEVLELLADPTAVMTITGPHPKYKQRQAYYDLEVCDPTQGDTYTIKGVEVSNFVTRAYFNLPDGVHEATNYLKLPLKPFGVRRKGYFQYEDKRGAHEIDGKRPVRERAMRREARACMAGARRNTRRAERNY